MNRFELKMSQDGCDDLKEIFVDIHDAYPRVDMLHRWSSRWKAADPPDRTRGLRYEARTEYTDPEGNWVYVVVQIDEDHDVKVVFIREEGL